MDYYKLKNFLKSSLNKLIILLISSCIAFISNEIYNTKQDIIYNITLYSTIGFATLTFLFLGIFYSVQCKFDRDIHNEYLKFEKRLKDESKHNSKKRRFSKRNT